ncbi:MAG: nitroreductase [Actinobacteria bacterium]|nr:MAG: nitroreductase [Actinomycetota bacterium]
MSTSASTTEALQALLESRHSCRAFLPEPVPRADIERLLELAQQTASWCNAQPWQVTIVSGEQARRLADELVAYASSHERYPDLPAPTAYDGVYGTRRRESGLALYAALGIGREDRNRREDQRLENFRLFGAPHVAIITTDRALGTYGAIDCGAYVATFLLAAESLGIATIAQGALAMTAPAVREFLWLPEDRLVVCGISFGYEDRDHPANAFRTSRAELADAVSWVGE